MWKKSKFFSLFVTSILILSMLIGMVGSIEDQDNKIILVITEEESERERLKDYDIEMIDSYGIYNIVKLADQKINLLQENEFELDLLEGDNTLHINGIEYDIDKDLDKIKEFDQISSRKEDLFIIDMIGPVNNEWRSKLDNSGIDILNYIPDYAYLVKMGEIEFKRAKKMFFVENIIHYDSRFKIGQEIKEGNIKINFIDNVDKLPRYIGNNIKIYSKTSSEQGSNIKGQVNDDHYIQKLAERNDVLSITSWDPKELKSEQQSQIIGGFWDSSNPSIPYRGFGDYGAFVNQIGYTGKGVTIGFADTGLGNGDIGDAGHNDFTGRVVGGINYGYGSDWSDGYGHGTHVTGIAAGDTYHGNNLTYEGHGPYYLSQGLAYDSNLFAQKIFSDSGSWLDNTPSLYELLEDAKRQGDVYIHSNSWGEDTGDSVYDEMDSNYDRGVRDSDSQEIGNQPIVVVVSAGNEGNNGDQTIASPGNGKNVITVGATSNYMPEATNYGYRGTNCYDPFEMFYKSSRGWTIDNRVKPTVVAPGEAILSTSSPMSGGSNLAGLYSVDSKYEWSSGTSQAAPAGAGAAAVIVDYYKEKYGTRPSPAMVKSLMINAAEDLQIDHDGDGYIDHIPNKYEGWGKINLARICDPDVNVMTVDQKSLLKTGQRDNFDINYYDSNKPLKITLTWTDEEAQSGENPALKNDLNLALEAPNGEIYRGNAFQNGYTPSGVQTNSDFDRNDDGYDDTNVVENIFIPSNELQTGKYTVRIIGENIPADSNNDGIANQDYALTMYNADNLSADGVVNIENDIYGLDDTVNITVEDINLTSETVSVNVSSNTDPDEKNIYLDKVAQGIYSGSIKISNKSGVGDLKVSDGDEILVRYYDKNTSTGSSQIKEDTAFVDGSPPNIIDIIVHSKIAAKIQIKTDEPCISKIKYGRTKSLNNSIVSAETITNHSFVIENLRPGLSYSYEIICEDQYGNKLVDNNNGDLYSFKIKDSDNFEAGNVGWNATKNWLISDLQNESSDMSWVCGKGGYGVGWYEVLTSPSVDLSEMDEASLSIYHSYDFVKGRDGGLVQIETFDGWQTITPENGYDGVIEYGHGNELEGDETFTGETNWTSDKFIFNRSRCSDEFRFRFVMGSDYIDTEDFGWRIDNIKLNGTKAPIPNFSYEPINPSTSDIVQFYDESFDLDGKIVNWTWDFGDGDVSYEEDPTHSYSDDGEYEIRLEIIDDFGIERGLSKQINISNEPPIANFTYTPSSIRSGELVRFEDTSFDLDGKIVNWTWDFGDGNVSYLENPTHRYLTDDNYLVELEIEDDDGRISHKIKSIEVENAFPKAEFNFTPTENISTQDTIEFQDGSKDIDGHIVNWTWDFGDGNHSYQKDPRHSYNDDGIYNVSLTVWDDDGEKNTTFRSIKVNNVKPDANFIFDPKDPLTNTAIKFQDRSSDIDGNIKEWEWFFGDESTSSLKNPEHKYSDNGTYVVELKVTDCDGAVSNITKKVDVMNRPPKVNFSFSQNKHSSNRMISFYANCEDSDGKIVNWTWDFGDETVMYGENVTHKFRSTGKFSVSLIVTDDDGVYNSTEKIVEIEQEEVDEDNDLPVGVILGSLLVSLSIFFVVYGIWVLKNRIEYL